MVYEEYLSLSIALRPLQRANASLNHLFYNKLIIATLFMAKSLIIFLSDYSEFRTVLQYMFLAVMAMLLMSLI